MLWWDDIAKGLAKQSQQTEQSETKTKKEQSADTSTRPCKKILFLLSFFNLNLSKNCFSNVYKKLVNTDKIR